VSGAVRRDVLVSVVLALVAGAAVGSLSGRWANALVGAACGAAVAWVAREPRLGLIAILLALPLDRFGRLIESPVILTAYHSMLLLTLASWGWSLLRRRESLRLSAVDLGMGALLFAAVWSLPLSLARGATAVAVVRIGFSAALVLLFANLASDARWLRRLAAAFAVTAVLSAIAAVAQYSVPGFPIPMIDAVVLADGTKVWRASGLFEDPNFLGAFLGLAVVAFAGAAAHARAWAKAALWLAAAGMCAGALALTLSRGSWVGTLVGLVVVALTAPGARRTPILAAGAALLVAAALLAPTAVRERAISSASVTTDASAATRLQLYGSAASMARDHWLFGVGLGAFDKAYPRYGGGRIVKPHEVPVSLVAQTGLPGLFAEVAIVLGIAIELRRRRGTVRSVYGSVALAGLASLGAGMLFENLLYVEYVWVFVALAVVAGRVLPRTARPAEEGLWPRLAICTSVHPSVDARVVYREGRMLAAEFDTTLYLFEDGPDSEVASTASGRALAVRRRGAPASRLRRFLSGGRLLRTALADEPDMLLIHDPELLPWLATVSHEGLVTAYDAHEDYPAMVLDKAWIPKVLRRAVAWMTDVTERTLSRGLSRIVVADPYLVERFEGRRTPPVLVRNHAPLDLFDTGPPARERPHVVAYVGGITAVRGSAAMLEAFRLARETVTDAEFVLVGPVQDSSVSGLPDGARMTGRLSYDRIGEHLVTARAGFAIWADTPKNRHNVPSKVFDYMAAGVPFITSDFPNIREACGSRGGLFFGPEDTRGMADALVRLFTEDAYADALQADALTAVRERYSFHEDGQRLIEALREALAEAGSPAGRQEA
jgi:O-antigen ligase/glycosyltransferase involved in cell wall biosynthesis